MAEPIWRRGVGGRHPPPPCAGCAPGRSPLLFPPSWLGVALGEEEAVSGGGGAAMRQLPYFCRGEVVKGFGRGSRQLGVPTGERAGWAGRWAGRWAVQPPPGPSVLRLTAAPRAGRAELGRASAALSAAGGGGAFIASYVLVK